MYSHNFLQRFFLLLLAMNFICSEVKCGDISIFNSQFEISAKHLPHKSITKGRNISNSKLIFLFNSYRHKVLLIFILLSLQIVMTSILAYNYQKIFFFVSN
jgi:type IV secretory pathway TrbL component